jgi:hypothetical protein
LSKALKRPNEDSRLSTEHSQLEHLLNTLQLVQRQIDLILYSRGQKKCAFCILVWGFGSQKVLRPTYLQCVCIGDQPRAFIQCVGVTPLSPYRPHRRALQHALLECLSATGASTRAWLKQRRSVTNTINSSHKRCNGRVANGVTHAVSGRVGGDALVDKRVKFINPIFDCRQPSNLNHNDAESRKRKS